ncbi:hypothetical protein A9993_12215 [Rahnella victoriana]|uniref:hypothetical protein n=1 Tax=Rahnella victoriana TaxID=1510570 RepID=UPI000BB175BE|nr:hypothetical protein [Rahnella victoriana]PBI80446.1 hypothetical protein A9993_12215 [Rahnella victoriana]
MKSLKSLYKITPDPHEDKKNCEIAIRRGWLAGIFTLALTLLALIFNRQSNNVYFTYIIPPDEFFIIALLTLMIYRKSRTGSLLMVIYFIIQRVILLAAGSHPTLGKVLMTLIIFYCYSGAARGIFIWHKKYNG